MNATLTYVFRWVFYGTAQAQTVDINSSVPTTFLEKQWVSLFQDSEYPAVKLALVLFAWHEFVFYARYLPFVACDYIPYFRQYKIQQVRVFIPYCLCLSVDVYVVGDACSLDTPGTQIEQGKFQGTDLEMHCPCDSRSDLC